MIKKLVYLNLFIIVLGLSGLLLFPQKVLTAYATLFTINNATKNADAIIILSGNVKTRPDAAAQLYLQNYAATVFITEAKEEHTKHYELLGSDRAKTVEILKKYNIPYKLLASSKNGATSTFDEAYDLVGFLDAQEKKKRYKKIIIVTDEYHTARAAYAFTKVLKQHGYENVIIEMYAAQNALFNTSNWYKTEKGVTAYILEPIKFLFYIFRSRNSTLVQEN